MPAWARSVRFRLALVYSAIVFGLAALLVVGVYFGVSKSIEGQLMSQDIVIREFRRLGPVVAVEQTVFTQTYETLESLVTQRTLDRLRDISVIGLAGLFPVSVLIGWLVAGRALRPIEKVTSVARDIQATDLSRRIELQGPDDELKRLADTFDDMLARIEESAESQRAFIHDTSHELRNPLAVMATNLDVVMADDDASVDDYRTVADVVRRSINRITSTVEDLLTYARRDARSQRIDRVDVARLVDEIAAEFRGPASERQILVEGKAEDAPPFRADGAALRQALQNLVGNAVRLAPVASTIEIAAGSEQGWRWFGVRDEGPGIGGADQPLVWQRYWRGDGPGRADPERSGLGLAIVRQVAESHGGTVQLLSAEGSGSTFLIWIPESRPAAGPAPLNAPNPMG